MGVKGYKISYTFKTTEPKASYKYQRFFRAIYGYTQVVSKSNGRQYIYRRKGVLSDYPYIKVSKKTVIVPSNAMSAMLNFFKTAENPAHSFQNISEWVKNVVYNIEEVIVPEEDVKTAIYDALSRIVIPLSTTTYSGIDALKNADSLSKNDAFLVLSSLKNVFESDWCEALKSDPAISELFEKYSTIKAVYFE